MFTDLHDAELATYLSNNLTDLEFELLIRERIKREFRMAHAVFEQFAESHNECRFVFSQEDACKWHVGLGTTYRDTVSLNGEVLHTSVQNAIHQYRMQHGNKLSVLLPPPTETPVEDDEIKW